MISRWLKCPSNLTNPLTQTREAIEPTSLIRHSRQTTLCLVRNLQASISSQRYGSSASSTRWKARQANDAFAREARVAGLKSRAAFKLLQACRYQATALYGSPIANFNGLDQRQTSHLQEGRDDRRSSMLGTLEDARDRKQSDLLPT